MVKFEPTTPNMSQHVATRWPNARNMLRPTMLRYVVLPCCNRLAGACRIITGKRKFDHIIPVLRELRWLPVTSFLKYTLGVLTFKRVKGLAPSYLCHRFKTRACVHDRNARYKNNLNIPAYKSASGQRTFLYRAVSFWNSLPHEIRECDNLPIFKRHLKEFLSSF